MGPKIGGARWEHPGALNCIQRHRTALNCTHPDLAISVFPGQSRCSLLRKTEVVTRSARGLLGPSDLG